MDSRGWLVPKLKDIVGRARERRAVYLLDVFQDSIAVLSEDGTIIRTNRSWRDFARDNALPDSTAGIGASYLAVCDRAAEAGDTDAAEAAAGIRAVLEGRRPSFRMTYPCHGPTQPRWCDLYVSAVNGPGRARALVRHSDTTALVLAAAEQERARAAAEVAKDANTAKSRFLAMASHDLRQPMMALRLFLEVLSRRITDAQLRPVVDRANETLAALTDLFESLLDLSQLETGQRAVQAMPIGINDLLDRLRGEFEIMARDKGLSFRVKPCGLTVYGDPVLLERILRNFISNAIRYTDRGGVLVGCRRAGDRLRIEVVDTGIGIPAEQKALIFRESYRAAGGGRGPEQGYGLGLAIVQRAAGMMRAPVEVVSTPGKGSRFSITVPTTRQRAEPEVLAPAGVAKAVAGRPCLALVIEDDPMVALALRLFLEEVGSTVLTATSAEEAERLVHASPVLPDLLIANYHLGRDRSGLTAVERLRRDVGEETPAWLVTGDVSAELYGIARASRVGYLRKPVRPEDIQACVLACNTANQPARRNGRRAG